MTIPDLNRRIEAALQAGLKWHGVGATETVDQVTLGAWRQLFKRMFEAALPELFTDPPTYWLAPTQISAKTKIEDHGFWDVMDVDDVWESFRAHLGKQSEGSGNA
jgi:hypothetical protein